ncbi:UDP-3-O-[3-hydroxymyristoyl] glucosamine N-acyltransferase [Rhodovulum imhoffii]|uniref:UDP-3-O-acylglucosamine N-acyltransferase n=1 Tax=Rhodovulum imhoffii TaxID=365340 RepID=A0A2T5BTI7_9RHOB|nr:UDP-3-O-(3-hydroxymyristoyl)glucosamine N-acyltransferase [Rhodovulum imhoffii]MBK5934317.1 UDP-3-O-(3-hydroxymyristoyl)glucosamine N-acyltransferase [Rhodovulum imhoffii]PTN02733.1 UDP-3-O-[3-hydroxymyristoyl] glucosamine N-acyltransferase [Rhodovulum imhoffii]
MTYRIADIAVALGAEAQGDLALRVKGAAEPAQAGPEHLALAMDPKFAEGLKAGQAHAALLWGGADWRALGLKAAIFVPRPRFAMAGLTRLMDVGPLIPPGVHFSAVIDPSATIGDGAAVGPFAMIGAGAVIGPRARIAAHVCIAEDVRIGADALLLHGVKVGARVVIGDRFIAQPGAVIGADGFSFVTPEKSAAENARETMGDTGQAPPQSWVRIHSLGAVRIGDDVEVGANTTIDRGTIRDTEIGSGSKLDNLVQVGHNVVIGRDCLLCGQSGVAGSARLGNRVVVGGAASVADHLSVGDDAVIAGKSGVASNVPAGRAVMGYPAMPMERNVEAYKALRRLPRLFAQVAALQKAVSKPQKTD